MQQLKMTERCTSQWFHRLSASSALPAFPNATRALQTLVGFRPESRRDMSYAVHLFMFSVIVTSHIGIQTRQFLP